MIKVGSFELRSIVTGRYRLDGGAMFGVVPKVVWQKSEDVDDLNRIAMVMRTLLAVDREQRRVILVDTGAGDKWEPDEASRFAIEADPDAIPQALAACGLASEDITDVIITHWHFDHNGGVTVWDGPRPGDHSKAHSAPAGTGARGADPERTRLRYPNATHWIHEAQWRHAQAPSPKDRASFLDRDFACLRESDRLRVVEGDAPSPPADGIRWLVSHGHTPGQLLPIFEDDRDRLLFVGDLIPTSTHLSPAWVMAYDLFPLQTIEEKKRVLRWCQSDGMMLAFPHDRRMGGARVDAGGRRPTAVPIDL